ncbi:tRNA dimethylallyltransferase 2 [Glycine soja]
MMQDHFLSSWKIRFDLHRMHHPSPIMAGNYYNVVIIHKQKVRLLIYLCLGMGDRGKHEDLQMAIGMSMQHTTPEPFKKRKERNILQKMKKRIIDDILARNHLPVIVGGTNYYIQALVSPFLLDDSAEDMDEKLFRGSGDSLFAEDDCSNNSYDMLKDIDLVAANRIHPNNHRKINQYINLYNCTGVLPSNIFQGKAAEMKSNNLRYDCCFICVDASLRVLDRYVEQRVDCMMYEGLLNEVYNIYNLNAVYTRGLRQAIGVREFEPLLRTCVVKDMYERERELTEGSSIEKGATLFNRNLMELVRSSSNTEPTILLEEAIEKVKLNTRRLVRRQKRMLSRLQTLFGWNIHYVDSTESISSKSEDVWTRQVVESAVEINGSLPSTFGTSNDTGMKIILRDLWTQSYARPAEIVCLEDYMNGSNTNKVVGTENVFLVSRVRGKFLVLWKRRMSILRVNSEISCKFEIPSSYEMKYIRVLLLTACHGRVEKYNWCTFKEKNTDAVWEVAGESGHDNVHYRIRPQHSVNDTLRAGKHHQRVIGSDGCSLTGSPILHVPNSRTRSMFRKLRQCFLKKRVISVREESQMKRMKIIKKIHKHFNFSHFRKKLKFHNMVMHPPLPMAFPLKPKKGAREQRTHSSRTNKEGII